LEISKFWFFKFQNYYLKNKKVDIIIFLKQIIYIFEVIILLKLYILTKNEDFSYFVAIKKNFISSIWIFLIINIEYSCIYLITIPHYLKKNK